MSVVPLNRADPVLLWLSMYVYAMDARPCLLSNKSSLSESCIALQYSYFTATSSFSVCAQEPRNLTKRPTTCAPGPGLIIPDDRNYEADTADHKITEKKTLRQVHPRKPRRVRGQPSVRCGCQPKPLQGYFTHKKTHPPRTLPYACA